MIALSKAKYIDRDDFDDDHYADFMRDSHRSRLTLEQLDIAKRQLQRTEKLLTRIHNLKMKEHLRVKNDFVRKVQQDLRISNLPGVKQTLKGQRKQRSELLPSPVGKEASQEVPTSNREEEEKSPKLVKRRKSFVRSDTPRTEKFKVNIDKFNQINSLLG